MNDRDLSTIIEDAYIFGFPLVLMDVSKQVMTAAGGGQKTPVNQLGHMRQFPDDTFTDIVSPNVDTLYTMAWLDLSQEPLILSLPDTGDRYYVAQFMDSWTNVFATLGTRTTGNSQGDFAITGPNWNGNLPEGVEKIQAPTNMVWMIGRTQTNGKADYAAVHAIQDQYKLTPLSNWGQQHTPPPVPPAPDSDTKTPPVQQVLKMDGETFFSRFTTLMQANPPAVADSAALKRFALVGIAPGKPFTPPPEAFRAAQAKLAQEAKKPHGKQINGWLILPDNTANFSTDYVWRAVVALVGLGANLPADAIYPHAAVDSEGAPLTGSNRYTIHFTKEQLPPVNAFWSLTIYNQKQALVKNPLNRFAIGDRDKLQFASDGSLTLIIQHDPPAPDQESNWLPAPADSFNLFLRLYWPKQQVLDGTWQPPAIVKVT